MEQGSDKTIHPRKVLYIILLIQTFLLLFVFLMPGGEWKITSDYSLHFVPLQEVWHGKRVQQKDIKQLVAAVQVDSIGGEAETFVTAKTDSALHPTDTLTDFPIQHTANAATDLSGFFEALHQCALNGSPVAIAYYGDSQIEGDRFSDYLRNKLQKHYGGGGPGMVTPMDISNMRLTIQQSESKEWIKQACFGYPQTKMEGGRFGLSGAVYHYRNGYYVSRKIPKDSTGKDSIIQNKWISSTSNPWLQFKRSKLSYATVKKYNQVSLWYSSKEDIRLKAEVNAGVVTDTLGATELGVKTFPSADSLGLVKLTFLSATSPEIIGVAFDREQGVRVDNYSMRGSSGTDFVKLNGAFWATQHKQRNTRFIILQYGVNVVPYVKDSQAVQYYESSFRKQLELLKRQLPEVSILVVGTTDISTKSGTDYVSYPYLEMIRDAQKRAAFKTGCAFWDAYEAMGGKNSMAAWVFHNPPLAAKDFTHLAPRGANILSEMLYKALMKDYYQYLKQRGS